MLNEVFKKFPRWYELSMHISASITIPFNIFGLIMIAFFSKEQMRKYRYYLLFHQICSTLSDIIINTGTIPVIYSPYSIVATHGWMTKIFELLLGIENSTWLQMEIIIHSHLTTALSVELLFLYRYQVILPITHPWKLRRISKFLAVFIYHLIWIILVSISFYNIIPNDQAGVKDQFRKHHPDLTFFVKDNHSLIVATKINLNFLIFFIVCLTRFGGGLLICSIFIVLSRYSLNHTKMSAKTRNMHLNLICILCYQVSIPIVAFYFPILAILTPLLLKIHHTFNLVLISLIILSFHTFLGTLSLLYFNRPWAVPKKLKRLGQSVSIFSSEKETRSGLIPLKRSSATSI